MKNKYLRKITIDWLKNKINYVYHLQNDKFNIIDSEEKNFRNRLGLLLNASRVHRDDLEASSCYIIESINSNININYKNKDRRNYTYNNFNMPINEYIFDLMLMCNYCQNYVPKDTIQNRATILSLLSELESKFKKRNKFIDKNFKITYEHFFKDFNKDNFYDIKNDIENLMISNNFDFNDFNENYISLMLSRCKDIEEVGIFYPCKFDHDIFKNEFHLFEINHIRFKRTNNINFLKRVKDFYSKYHQNIDEFPLDRYFTSSSNGYRKDIAYFDPFLFLEHYEVKFTNLLDYINNKKYDVNEFMFDFFNFLNIAQYNAVRFQHQNLIDMLTIHRSKDRQYSAKELVSKKIKQITKDQNETQCYSQIDFASNLNVLVQIEEMLNINSYHKNITIDDLGFKNEDSTIRNIAETTLEDIKAVIGNHSTLQYIIDYSHKKAKRLIEKYELQAVYKVYYDNHGLNKKERYKDIIDQIIIDLIFFYKKPIDYKLSNRVNVVFEQIFKENENIDIVKQINFNFEEEFIKKHHDEFDNYKKFPWE